MCDQFGGSLVEFQISLDLPQFSLAQEAKQKMVSKLNILLKIRYRVASSANSLSKSVCSIRGREIPLRALYGSVRKQCLTSANMRKRYGTRDQPCRIDLDWGILSPFMPDKRTRLRAVEYIARMSLDPCFKETHFSWGSPKGENVIKDNSPRHKVHFTNEWFLEETYLILSSGTSHIFYILSWAPWSVSTYGCLYVCYPPLGQGR